MVSHSAPKSPIFRLPTQTSQILNMTLKLFIKLYSYVRSRFQGYEDFF